MSEDTKALRDFLVTYSLDDLAKAFFALNLWLPNIASPIKLQYLYVTLESIHRNLATDSKLTTYAEFEYFYRELFQLLPSFVMLEDYVPEADWGEIKYYFDNRFYRIFYGGDLSNPYDFYYAFEMIHRTFDEQYAELLHRSPIQEMRFCLEAQNHILENLIQEQTEAMDAVSPGELFIPSEDFLNRVTEFLDGFRPDDIYREDILRLYTKDLAEPAAQPSMDTFIENAYRGRNCGYMFIKKGDKYYPVMPRKWLTVIYDNWGFILRDNYEEILKTLGERDLFLDCFSRAITGFVLSAKQPDSWTMSILLMKAVLPKENPLWINKGLPVEIQPDRGKNLIAAHVVSVMKRLDIDYIPDPPYYPDNKGKVERWFLTLETGCLKILPGHMNAIGKTSAAAERHVAILLTVPQLRQEIERWIIEDYHEHKHSETGRKPAELWEETVRMLPPNDEEVFTLCLLKDSKERVVGNTGVRFTPRENNFTKNRYWSPELTQYGGQSVRVAYNPDDLECVHLYDAETDEFLCEAWWMNSPNPRYTVEDVKSARNTFRRGMCERLKEYRATIEQEDRLNARQVEWENARRIADSLQERAASIIPTDPQPDEVEALLKLLERQAAGEE